MFPKWEAAGYKVTFIDEDKTYATVQVEENKSINGDEWTTESMPADPSKPGFTFNGWFTEKDGQGTQFTGDTPVSGSISVYSSYTSKTPTPKPKPTPTPTPIPETEPELEAEPEPEFAPAPSQPEQLEQPEQPEAKRVVERLPQTGSTTTPVLASAIASLFAGLAGFAKSFAATRKRRN